MPNLEINTSVRYDKFTRELKLKLSRGCYRCRGQEASNRRSPSSRLEWTSDDRRRSYLESVRSTTSRLTTDILVYKYLYIGLYAVVCQDQCITSIIIKSIKIEDYKYIFL